MKKITKDIVELAVIELMYAKSDITHSQSCDEEVSRAAEHIESAINTLAGLAPDDEDRRKLASLLPRRSRPGG